MLVKFMCSSSKFFPSNKKLLIQKLACYLDLITSEKLSSMTQVKKIIH